MLMASAAGGYTGSGIPGAPPASAGTQRKYRLAPWTGDDYTLGHRMRAGDIPPLPRSSERRVDFVIIGGGMAGLASAYFLRDHDFLLLEQYAELGGQSRGKSYRGLDYSLGAAYMGSSDGIYGELFADLGLKPVELPDTKNSWYREGRWFPGVRGADQDILYKSFARLIAQCKPVWKLMPNGELELPVQGPDLERLDMQPFSAHLEGYDPKFVALVDSICKSSCCGTTSELSALAGFYLMQDLVSPSYVFEGGNPALARALASRIEESGRRRCLTGTFVWNVSLRSGGASVDYSTADGAMHRVECRKVIVTAPPLVTGRIIPDLDDKAKAVLLWFKYGSYLVANFCMPKKIFDGAYDNWVGSPFTFADAVVAETPYIATGSYKKMMGSVLTVYQPYSARSTGREILYEGNREELAGELIEQLSRLVEQFQNNLDEVVLTRWGHAMVVAQPGMFAKLTRLLALDTDPLLLAHNSMRGVPSAESAIQAGRLAAQRCLGIHRKTG